MAHISAIDANKSVSSKAATYNAVKIQINDPKTNISPNYQSNPLDNGTYNAVAIDVNRPSVESAQKHNHEHCIYDYPCAECAVNSNYAPIHSVNVPDFSLLPVAYQTTNFINNRTLISAEVEVDNKSNDKMNPEATIKSAQPESEVIVMEKIISVPEPNVVNVEEQKAEPEQLAFHGINFKAVPKHSIEIVPGEEIKPDIDIPQVLSNLSSEDYDLQAQQMEEIAKVSMQDPQKAVPYIVTEVFNELINIVKKDTKNLVPPSERQIELRQQIIVNELVKEQAITKQQDITNIDLPYKLSDGDIREASNLSSMEQAERNKEYALYTMAVLAKVYGDEIHRHTNNVVPLTDMPGVSAIVDTLRNEENSGVKIAAIDALRYLYRTEYKDELSSVLTLAANDTNPYVARNAAVALENLE